MPFSEVILFAAAAFLLVISPGPNMLYLISRSMTQGSKAGMISLGGVLTGLMVHTILVSAGLSTILITVPYAYQAIKILGIFYLLYLAWQSVKPGSRNIFDKSKTISNGSSDNIHSPAKLYLMGLFTNLLNPKVAIFYISLLPQFMHPAYGSYFLQGLLLGCVHILLSFIINSLIVLSAAKISAWFSANPVWIRVQKWMMATVLTALAIRMAFDRQK